MPDGPKPLTDLWAVWREDTHGTQFKMRSGLSKEEAQTIAAKFESKGHKQHYWVKPDHDK